MKKLVGGRGRERRIKEEFEELVQSLEAQLNFEEKQGQKVGLCFFGEMLVAVVHSSVVDCGYGVAVRTHLRHLVG